MTVLMRLVALCLFLVAALAVPARAINLPVPLVTGSGTITVIEAYEFVVCTASCNVQPLVPHPGYQLCVWSANNVAAVITLKALGGGASYQNTVRTGYGTPGTGTLASGGSAGDLICIVGYDMTHYNTTTNTNAWTIN
jgi:hypothetical protein